MYRERPARLDGAVLWTSTARTAHKRVLPDGCMDLLWSGGTLRVAGPDTTAAIVATRPGETVVGLRLAPGALPWLLGVHADELRDRRVPLDAVWPSADVRRWTERVGEAGRPGDVLEELAAQVATGADPPPPEVAAIVAELRQGRTVADVADRVGLSDRHLHRRSLHTFGYGAKRLGRILRLQRALTLGSAGVPLAAVAARTGYVDQPHLARDVRSLTGVSLGTLLS